MASILLNEEDRQLTLLALAWLSLARPGLESALHTIAFQIDNHHEGRAVMFDQFRSYNRDQVKAVK